MAADNVVLSAATWLPPMLWLVAAGSGLVAVIAAGLYLHDLSKHQRETVIPELPPTCFYINDEIVEDIYKNRHREGLKHNAETSIRTNKGGSAKTKLLPGTEAGVERSTDVQETLSYPVDRKPIDVIHELVKELDRDELIIHVVNGELRPGKALNRALTAAHGSAAGRPNSARLRDLRGYISVHGQVKGGPAAETDTTFTLSALPGKPTGAQVDITCESVRLLARVPQVPSTACCFGRMKRDTDTGEWAIDPIAIFME